MPLADRYVERHVSNLSPHLLSWAHKFEELSKTCLLVGLDRPRVGEQAIDTEANQLWKVVKQLHLPIPLLWSSLHDLF